VTSSHIRHNRAFWDADSDNYQADHGGALDRAPLAWGAYRIPEAQLRILGDVRGRDVLELGCGAGQWSIALAAQGGHVTGLDLSERQLGHARRSDSSLPLVQASGEQLPFSSGAFDVVFCDHGALSFCEPEVIVPECARVLRVGGLLAFCGTHPLLYLTWDPVERRQTRKLQIDYDTLGEMPPEDGTVDWSLPPSDWIRVLRSHGFAIENLIELVAPAAATTTYEDFAPPKWARRWPAEWIWQARRT
jgi:SAM-dependent methyltransferase